MSKIGGVRGRRGPDQWASIVHRMVFLGAPVSGKDEQTIIAYRGAKFGAQKD